ncbi:MAG: DUF3131 domain-containing protein [Bacteroidetes bacterium]|nr:DUF3131 domain-containing protein [Bacteroidota bacterium]
MKKNYSLLLKPLIVIVALLGGTYLVLWVEKSKPSDFGFYKDIFSKEVLIAKSNYYPLRNKTPLNKKEMDMARIAWKYFQNNYYDSTGLVNASDKYPAATMWDITSSALGIISAYEIGIIDSTECCTKIKKQLISLSKIPLFHGKLPHKVYNVLTLQMVDYGNNELPKGLGWTAIDIGRFFVLVNKIYRDYPQFTLLINKVIGRWNLDEMINDGFLQGTFFTSKDRRPKLIQEGRLGYEEYASKGLCFTGFDLWNAMNYSDFIHFARFGKIDIGYDLRESSTEPSYNFTLSEPYVLDGIEYGWNKDARELAWRIFNVQKERYSETGYVTAVSEDHIDTLPYLVYNAVVNEGKKWDCISESGDDANEFKTLSTKAALGWYVLFADEYSNILFDAIKNLYDPNKGWYAGLYEKTKRPNKAINVNTNGIILECLNYKMNGKLVNTYHSVDTTEVQKYNE